MCAKEGEKLHGIRPQFVDERAHKVKYRKVKLVFLLPENAACHKHKNKERKDKESKNNDQFN